MGMYPYLMGTFTCPVPVLLIGSSLGKASTSLNSVSFRTSHMEDPWILPSSSPSSDNSIPFEIDVSLYATLVAYQANIDHVVVPSPSSSWTEEEDPYVFPAWVVESSHSHDCLDDVFSSDEAIIEAMSGVEPPWEELHHRSYFLPKLDHLECEDFREILSQIIGIPIVPLSSPGPMADGKMVNISPTIPINISHDPGKIENVYIGAECSHVEILEYNKLFEPLDRPYFLYFTILMLSPL